MKQEELSKKEIENILNEFYNSFENGYDFEQFLKIYLESIGLDEIEVTQKSGDGGIDLKAIKKGIDELTELDSIKYYIQAKRYKPNSNVSIESVRALRGILPDGFKGIFITTGKFSKKAYEFASESQSRPLILIDGIQLITNCIEKGLGFRVKPVFHKNDLLLLINKEKMVEEETTRNNDNEKIDAEQFIKFIKKTITENDIKARILRIPKTIVEKIPSDNNSYCVLFNEDEKKLNIDKTRTFFSGITELYRKYGLLDDNGNRISKDAFWYFDENNKRIILETEKSL
jgi:restriction system protein